MFWIEQNYPSLTHPILSNQPSFRQYQLFINDNIFQWFIYKLIQLIYWFNHRILPNNYLKLICSWMSLFVIPVSQKQPYPNSFTFFSDWLMSTTNNSMEEMIITNLCYTCWNIQWWLWLTYIETKHYQVLWMMME